MQSPIAQHASLNTENINNKNNIEKLKLEPGVPLYGVLLMNKYQPALRASSAAGSISSSTEHSRASEVQCCLPHIN